MNLQDLCFKYLQLLHVTVQGGLRFAMESEWCFGIGSCASDMKLKRSRRLQSVCFPKG